jgi:hypothetical protein
MSGGRRAILDYIVFYTYSVLFLDMPGSSVRGMNDLEFLGNFSYSHSRAQAQEA